MSGKASELAFPNSFGVSLKPLVPYNKELGGFMARFTSLFFDLDGTLTDPAEGIFHCVRYALSKFGVAAGEDRVLTAYIGPPLEDSFIGVHHLSEADAKMAIQYYRERYEAQGMFENRPYEGMPRLLTDLKEAGYRLFVMTLKPEVFARKILAHFGMDNCFDEIYGCELERSRIRKEEILRRALSEQGLEDVSLCLMIGDREQDVQAAKALGMACAGVLYGYGSLDELTAAGADFLVPDIPALRNLLLRSHSLL